jgi:hypothetical protein
MKDVEHGEAIEAEAGDSASKGEVTAARMEEPPPIADGPDAASRVGGLIAWVARHPRVPLVLALIAG